MLSIDNLKTFREYIPLSDNGGGHKRAVAVCADRGRSYKKSCVDAACDSADKALLIGAVYRRKGAVLVPQGLREIYAYSGRACGSGYRRLSDKKARL